MTVKPLDATGYHLSKYVWLNNVAVRYNKPLIEVPARCEACPDKEYTLEHALRCPRRSNRIDRHNTVKTCLCVIAQKALGKSAFYVHQEPPIVPAGGSDCEGNRLVKGLFGDVKLRGVHPIKEETIVDVHVIYSESAQNAMLRLSHLLPSFSTMKRRNIQARV